MLGPFGSPLRRVPFLRSLLDRLSLHKTALADAIYDLRRGYRYSLGAHTDSADRQRLESLLVFYYHKVEKGLALPEVKPVFGLGYMNMLLDLMEEWRERVGDRSAVCWRGACAALDAYWEHSKSALLEAEPALARRIEAFVEREHGPELEPDLGGTTTFAAEELRKAIEGLDFERFVAARLRTDLPGHHGFQCNKNRARDSPPSRFGGGCMSSMVHGPLRGGSSARDRRRDHSTPRAQEALSRALLRLRGPKLQVCPETCEAPRRDAVANHAERRLEADWKR